jgi:hypothetical protein
VLKPNAHGLQHTEANQPPPIALSEPQMCALLAASQPLPPALRSAFLEACAKEIAAMPELGDGAKLAGNSVGKLCEHGADRHADRPGEPALRNVAVFADLVKAIARSRVDGSLGHGFLRGPAEKHLETSDNKSSPEIRTGPVQIPFRVVGRRQDAR